MISDVSASLPWIRGRILIDGEIISKGYAMREVYSQCSEDGQQVLIGETPNVDANTFMLAVDSASKAWNRGQGNWALARMEERLNALSVLRGKMCASREMVCRSLMWEIGKTWTDAQGEFDRTIQYIDDTVEEVKRLDRDSSRFQFVGGLMAQIRRAPLGVTLCMGPFNYPLNEVFTTLIPALVMGNTAVVKIPRYGQLLWDYLLEGFQDAFPPGVVNIINGAGRNTVGPAIRSGKIDVLAFIGSSSVANKIKSSHPNPHRLRSILGLDAKNPAILLPDANIDLAAAECVRGALSFNGQRCTALKMIFVHRSIAKTFNEALVRKVESLKCGMPWEPNVQLTPLPDTAKPAYLTDLIKDAISLGAVLANPEHGGKVEGTLFHPAVLTDVPLTAKIAIEEQFGPVIPVHTYDDLSEVEQYIVESQYGAQVSIFGHDPEVVGPLVDRLVNQVCRINLNTQCQRGPDVFPFTGRKSSAEGTLSVHDALRSFSIRSMVATKQDSVGKTVVRGILDKDSSRFLTTNFLL